MMEVNIMNPEQTATHATYKKSVEGSILWNQGHIVALQCTMCTSCKEKKKQLMLVFSMPK